MAYNTDKPSSTADSHLLIFVTIHAPEKGNGIFLLNSNHYMNTSDNLLLDGSKFKKIFPDITLTLACCHD